MRNYERSWLRYDLLAVSWLTPRVPVPLIGMLLAAGAVAAFDLRACGVAVVGDIPGGLPTPSVPNVSGSGSDVASLLLPAIGVAIVA